MCHLDLYRCNTFLSLLFRNYACFGAFIGHWADSFAGLSAMTVLFAGHFLLTGSSSIDTMVSLELNFSLFCSC